MKQMTIVGIFIFLLSGLDLQYAQAQDPIYSQPYANPLYLNPAFAGTETSQRFGLNYQNIQPANSVMYNASYDRNFIDSNNGFGMLVNVEKSSLTGPYLEPNQDLTTTNISLIYAHQFHIKSFTLSAGVQATYVNLSLDQNKLAYTDWAYHRWFDWGEPLLRTQITLPDFSAGLLGYWKNYFAGFSITHLSQPDESFFQEPSTLRTKYIFNAGGMIHIRKVTLTPTIYFENQGTFHQQIIEGYVAYWHLIAGVGCSVQEIPTPANWDYPEAFNNVSTSMVLSLGYQCKLLRLACSYQCSPPEYSNGISEASLSFLLPYSNIKRKKVNGLNIPAF